jgi:Protein of unknown function (DUF4058)
MPLLDHFRPPLSVYRPWSGVHSTWASALAHQLNHGLLPAHYFAIPNVKLGGPVEIDVATLEAEGQGSTAAGGLATAVWAPPRPSLVADVDFVHLDLFEVQVFHEEGGPQLVAAIELVSPANKDRPGHRHAFAIKCASYLQQGIAVIVVDVVTERTANLHAELLDLLGLRDAGQPLPDLYAVSYRTVSSGNQCRLEAWPEPLAVGAVLPTVLLWIAFDQVVPVDLEQSYAAARDTLLIRG